ncbi:MAG: tyrosine decarboxylase MfnA [Candidatus Hydrothermarchaeota archaeon]
MREEGKSKAEIFKELEKYRDLDYRYENGRILSSMCTIPHEIAKEVFMNFFETNLGDPGLFSGTNYIEKEVISALGSLLGKNKACGYLVSGGTEANMMAMRVARNLKGIERPEVIIPESAHFSFDKAGDVLGINMRKVPLDGNFRADLEAVENSIGKNTIAIVGVAGTTEFGVIDPVEELAKLSLDYDLFLHIDAAFGGFVIPFLKEMGYNLPDFDFSINGVDSITIDPHKMGLAPIPSGGILFSDPKVLKYLEVETPYLTEPKQFTMVGTRPGASAAATWAVLNLLGRKGYREIVKNCMELTYYLADGIKKLGLKLPVEPTLNVLAFHVEDLDGVIKRLKKEGWIVSRTRKPPCIRIVIMPHVKKEHIDDFLETLEKILG